MALVRNDADYAVDLATGRLLLPGEIINADITNPHEAALIAARVLFVVDASAPPPEPPSTVAEVRALVPYSPAPDPVVIDMVNGKFPADLLPQFPVTSDAGEKSGYLTIDADENYENWVAVTLTGDLTNEILNLEPGTVVRLFITQDDVGGHSLTISNGTVSVEAAIPQDPGSVVLVAIYTVDGEDLRVVGGGPTLAPDERTAGFTLAAGDIDRTIELYGQTPLTVTLPADSDESIPIGASGVIKQTGYGQVRFAVGSGVTLHSRRRYRAISARYGKVTWEKTAANEFDLSGDLGQLHDFDVLVDVPGVVGYYKGDLVTGADGDSIATAADQSGNGYDLAQATGANQPTKHANVVNGHAVMRFDRAASQNLKHTTLPATGPSTIYVVAKETTRVSTATQVLVDRGAIGEGKITISSGATLFPGGSGSGSPPHIPNPPDWFVACAVFNRARSAVIVNEIDGSVTEDINVTAAGVTLGAQTGAANPFGGDVEELIVCTGAHDVDTQRKVVEYLLNQIGAA